MRCGQKFAHHYFGYSKPPVVKSKSQRTDPNFDFCQFSIRMHAREILNTNTCNGENWHGCLQPETLFSRMCATDIWATDACKVWGKSRMRANYIPDARNPINPVSNRFITRQRAACDIALKVYLKSFSIPQTRFPCILASCLMKCGFCMSKFTHRPYLYPALTLAHSPDP